MNSDAQPLIARHKADGAVLTATWPSVYRRLSALFPKLEPSLGERILGIDIEMEKAKKRKQKQIGKAS